MDVVWCGAASMCALLFIVVAVVYSTIHIVHFNRWVERSGVTAQDTLLLLSDIAYVNRILLFALQWNGISTKTDKAIRIHCGCVFS